MEKNIKKILETLESEGYQAYLVGGYVRDYLLGIASFDVDIATNALPKDIHRIFNSSKSNYGSVNIKIDKLNVDITTYRKDLNYINRRPSTVKYINNLEEDLKRRDFTINAICMDKNGNIIDPLNGCLDLDKRLIKMIGDVDIKIQEDPLRIMRAIRFACVLDFGIDNELYDKLKRDNTICILVDTSVKYIDRRLRSINELRDYLKNKEEDTIIIEEVIDKLIDNKYLDDDRFTKAFIKDKLNFTNWGDYKIKNELKRLGVNEEIIYNNISNIDDNIYYERINKIIDKDISTNKKYSGIKLKNKIYNHLLTLGYSKEKVISIINNYNF